MRREARDQWRKGKLEQAATGNWREYRETKPQTGLEWAVHFADEAATQSKEPLTWTIEHFRALFRSPRPRQVPLWTKARHPGTPFTRDELQEALAKGKRGKSVGMDNTSSELLRALAVDDSTLEALLDWMERIRQGEPMPPRWLQTIVTLLPKVPQPSQPGDLRPISVGSAVAKLFGTLLLERTKQHIRPLGHVQCSHGGRQTCDYLSSAIKVMMLDSEWKLGLHYIKLDVRKAFDSLCRDKVLTHLESRLPEHMALEYDCWVRLFEEGTATLKTPWGLVDIPQQRGIRQGSVESPFIFSVAMEVAVRSAQADPQWPSTIHSIPELEVQEILYML